MRRGIYCLLSVVLGIVLLAGLFPPGVVNAGVWYNEVILYDAEFDQSGSSVIFDNCSATVKINGILLDKSDCDVDNAKGTVSFKVGNNVEIELDFTVDSGYNMTLRVDGSDVLLNSGSYVFKAQKNNSDKYEILPVCTALHNTVNISGPSGANINYIQNRLDCTENGIINSISVAVDGTNFTMEGTGGSITTPMNSELRLDFDLENDYCAVVTCNGNVKKCTSGEHFNITTSATDETTYNISVAFAAEEPVSFVLNDISGSNTEYNDDFIDDCATIEYSLDGTNFTELSDNEAGIKNNLTVYTISNTDQVYMRLTWNSSNYMPQVVSTATGKNITGIRSGEIFTLVRGRYEISSLPYNITWSYDSTGAAEGTPVTHGRVSIQSGTGLTVVQDDEHGGNVFAVPGTLVTVKLIPDYGYQVLSGSIDGQQLTPDANVRNTFTFVMPQSDVRIQGVFTANEDIINITNPAIKSADVQVGNAVSSGNIRVNIGNTELADSEKQALISSVPNSEKLLFINLSIDNFWTQGNTGTEWTTGITESSSKFTVNIWLDPSMFTSSTQFCVARSHNGSIEVLGATYDSTTGKLSFMTDRFSSYMVAQLPETAGTNSTAGSTATQTTAVSQTTASSASSAASSDDSAAASLVSTGESPTTVLSVCAAVLIMSGFIVASVLIIRRKHEGK